MKLGKIEKRVLAALATNPCRDGDRYPPVGADFKYIAYYIWGNDAFYGSSGPEAHVNPLSRSCRWILEEKQCSLSRALRTLQEKGLVRKFSRRRLEELSMRGDFQMLQFGRSDMGFWWVRTKDLEHGIYSLMRPRLKQLPTVNLLPEVTIEEDTNGN